MEKYTEEPSEFTQKTPFDFRELYQKLIGYWRWIVGSMIIALIAGYIYVHTLPSSYQSTASILIIDQSKNGQMNAMSVVNEFGQLGITDNPPMVNDEEQVIHSRNMMKKVVYRLKLYTTYYHDRFFHKEELYISSPLIAEIDSTLLKHLHETLLIDVSPATDHTLTAEVHYGNKVQLWTIRKFPVILKTPVGTIILKQRLGFELPTERLYIQINNPIGVAKNLASSALTTDVGKQTDVIDLTILTGSMQKGEDILNTLIDVYNQDAIEQLNQSALSTASFINEQLKVLTGELSDVEQQAENFKQANNLVDIDSEASLFLQDANSYQQQTVTAETQLHLIDYVEKFVQNPKYNNALVPNLGLTDVGLIAVINTYDELVLERERIARNSTSNNPALIALNHQVEDARKAILTSIVNTRRGIQITLQDLGKQNTIMGSRIKDIPRQQREYLEIERQQKVKEELYLYLLQKREDASLTMAVTVPKARVIDSAEDAMKITPHASIIMLLFLAIGIAIPVVIILIKDWIDPTIHTTKEVETLTGINVFAELGHIQGDSKILTACRNEYTVELYKLLRAKLKFVFDSPSQKVITITSTQHGEGKTIVSANLAITLAMADKKVLLLGFDLRSPQITKFFGMSTDEGVTTYLIGNENDVHKLITPLADYPNLDVLPSGMIPPNPNELIMRSQVDNLINTLKPEYDYIIVDTAPVGAVSDTLLLQRITDITLYICRSGYTDREDMDYIKRLANDGSLKPMYLLLNDIEAQNHQYGYGYHYRKEHQINPHEVKK
ncbi:GumC family protein [Microbacter margulisiae]|uniref:non-specific protein-tyrosine kinase n=1 Tax=Microbacter margulisiae TaxID=1350067 RepID=A0A7W5DNN7_9PORP|nr:tyrosine-protein kinase [Microbacter margulisiae]MBB3185955.1 capsular exopolysaccharide synthesis family protein [Microbacter margulisiae]